MGAGYEFTCSKCGKKYSVCWGIGFMYPEVFSDTLKAIKKGEYGEEYKKLALSEKYVAVDAEEYVYSCRKCGNWTTEMGLSIYAPDNVERLKRKRSGIKTVEEWGEVPYATDYDFKRDYHLLKRRLHKCSKCGGIMHKASNKEIINLSCPECGGEQRDDLSLTIINWD